VARARQDQPLYIHRALRGGPALASSSPRRRQCLSSRERRQLPRRPRLLRLPWRPRLPQLPRLPRLPRRPRLPRLPRLPQLPRLPPWPARAWRHRAQLSSFPDATAPSEICREGRQRRGQRPGSTHPLFASSSGGWRADTRRGPHTRWGGVEEDTCAGATVFVRAGGMGDENAPNPKKLLKTLNPGLETLACQLRPLSPF